MWDVIAFYKSISSATLTQLDPVTTGEDIYSTSGSDFYLRGKNKLLWAFGIGTTATRAQLKTPIWSSVPIEVPVYRFGNFALLNDNWTNPFVGSPIVLGKPNDTLSGYGATGAGSAEDNYLVLALGDRPLRKVDKFDLIWRLTGSTTLTENAWTTVSLTPDVKLPAGKYRIVGMIAISAGAIAARIIPPAGETVRPGFVAGRTEHNAFINKNLFDTGIVFDPTSIPKVQFLSSSADTSETVLFFLRKVG